MDNPDLFCTGKVRMKMAMEKSKLSGQPVIRHRNGKVDLGAVLDDPATREHVCPYCSYSFAYKHVLERKNFFLFIRTNILKSLQN